MKNGPYVLVIPPQEYPGRRYRGRYVYEHHLVWWQNTGHLVPAGFDIHHRDGVKTRNEFENLALKPHGRHAGDHNSQRPLKEGPVHQTTLRRRALRSWQPNRADGADC